MITSLYMPTQVLANAGISIIDLSFPIMLLVLIPIIAVEAVVYLKLLGIPLRCVILPTAVANVATTLIGVPVSWMYQVVAVEQLEPWGGGEGFVPSTPMQKLVAILLQSGLPEYYDVSKWQVTAALMVSLLPLYVLTVLIEYFVVAHFLPDIDRRKVRKAVLVANAVSYALLLALGAVVLLGELG